MLTIRLICEVTVLITSQFERMSELGQLNFLYMADSAVITEDGLALRHDFKRGGFGRASSGNRWRCRAGRELIKQTGMELMEKARALLESVIESSMGQFVVSLQRGIRTRTGKRITIFTLGKGLGWKMFTRQLVSCLLFLLDKRMSSCKIVWWWQELRGLWIFSLLGNRLSFRPGGGK